MASQKDCERTGIAFLRPREGIKGPGQRRSPTYGEHDQHSVDGGQVPRAPHNMLSCPPRAHGCLLRNQAGRARMPPEGPRGAPPQLGAKAAVALPDLLAPGQVSAKARELYVQTCREGKKDKSPQADPGPRRSCWKVTVSAAGGRALGSPSWCSGGQEGSKGKLGSRSKARPGHPGPAAWLHPDHCGPRGDCC